MVSRRLNLSKYEPPTSAGVYIYRDGRKRPIYIGKAKNLSARINSYSQKALPDKTMAMLEAARTLDWIVFSSELEALLAEAAMVRQYKPKFNIALRDDKRFPSILITDEPFPKALKIRKPRPGRGRHFGPYRASTANFLLEIISRKFRLRRCSGPLPKRKRPCLDFDIKRCDGPCVEKISQAEYAKLVDGAVAMLSGKTRDLIRQLNKEMEYAAKELEFETAAALRDEVKALEDLAEKQEAERPGRGEADAIAVSRTDEIAVGIVMERRDGVVLDCHRYIFDTPIDTSPTELVRKILLTHYEVASVPSHILLDIESVDSDEIAVIQEALKITNKQCLKNPKRGPDRAFYKMAVENAVEEIRVQTTDRSTTLRNAALSGLAELLDLEGIPAAIEGYDISTMSGKDTVGACVRFNDGLPRKSFYRLYKIRGRKDSDVHAMNEVLSRRASSKDGYPDLILIDGGMGQLHAAWEGFVNNAVVSQDEMPIFVSLAKKEEKIFTMEGEVFDLDRASPVLRLLQQVRDESHRFVRNYHRKLRGKTTLS